MAATTGTVNPPTRQPPAFLANLMKSNQNIICTAKANDVRKVSISDLLKERLRIPIFQRRYCWGVDQWETLLNDALIVANGSKDKHSLGRITCVRNVGDQRLLVIDGQQRNTTCSLLLAAIRDVALENFSGDPSCEALATRLDSALLPDKIGFETWMSESDGPRQIAEGAALEFVALVPTYCDRASYFSSILPARAHVTDAGDWQRPREAKLHFMEKLGTLTIESLARLADAVLHKLEWLFFPICISGDHEDGTEDLQVIFERLAVRDAQFCRPGRATEFASMGAADFVRNLLLGSFCREVDSIAMYKKFWLPIESLASSASVLAQNSNVAAILEKMLGDFLKAQPDAVNQSKSKAVRLQIGGELYPRFRQWLTAALASDTSVVDGEAEAVALERKTADVLRRLRDFAIHYFAHGGTSKIAHAIQSI